MLVCSPGREDDARRIMLWPCAVAVCCGRVLWPCAVLWPYAVAVVYTRAVNAL